jgi:large repetitive protein
VTAIAIATDSAGNMEQSQTQVQVTAIDANAPVVRLNLSGIPDGVITAATDIIGTVSDVDLVSYKLEAALAGTEDFRLVAEGTQTVSDSVLGKFDPSLLENDTYTLRLTAIDAGGNISVIENTLDVVGELKLGNFRLSFTDLEIPVSGIPITVTRTYDSLTSHTTDDFGYGWRMEFRDTDLRTSLGRDRQYEELGLRSQSFDEKTRVYITLPGGKREAFTFKPKPLTQIRGGLNLGLLSGNVLEPAFVADKGSTSTLTVEPGTEGVWVTKINGGKYTSLNQYPYNPADTERGYSGVYVLTTKDGTKYRIDAQTGDLLTVEDTNGNKLTYTDDAIVSSTGKQVTFERDAQGRIKKVIDPMGKAVVYDYDATTGDLLKVTDRDLQRVIVKCGV